MVCERLSDRRCATAIKYLIITAIYKGDHYVHNLCKHPRSCGCGRKNQCKPTKPAGRTTQTNWKIYWNNHWLAGNHISCVSQPALAGSITKGFVSQITGAAWMRPRLHSRCFQFHENKIFYFSNPCLSVLLYTTIQRTRTPS